MILLALIAFGLIYETVRAVRSTKRPGAALVNAVLTAVVVWFVGASMNWNGQFPMWVWWIIALWTAALVGIRAARFFGDGMQKPAATPPAPRALPQAAAQTAPQ